MKQLQMLIIYLFLFFLFCFLPLQHALAADFSTGYTITYTISTNGMTHVDMKGTITNDTSKVYATSYMIALTFTDIHNILTSDAKGSITPKMTKTDDGTKLILLFNDKVAGVGKKMQFHLSFDTEDVAKHQGNIWEVTIPAMNNQSSFSDLTIKVIVPPTFGPVSIVKPHIDYQNNLFFTKNDLGTSGISLSFGPNQTYSYNLVYHLKNKNVFPIKTELALPPSTNYQTVVLSKITPHPENIVLDADGNWIAQYYLLPAQKIDVTAQGTILVYDVPTKVQISSTQKKEYMLPQQYWDSNVTTVMQKAHELKTPEAIYSYVVHTLHYDFNRISNDKPRLGAAAVLQNPSSAVCLEFTDAFIALARAAGIPAREVDGFAYSQNVKQRPLSYVKDILHAWPEYYDGNKQTWVMVDPTWGNTTHTINYFHQLDFDHVAFVIKGAESNYPIPAGVYKTEDDQNKKDVTIQFSKQTTIPSEQFSLTPITVNKYLAGLPITVSLQAKNAGTVMTQPQVISVTSDSLLPIQQNVLLTAIPPLGNVSEQFSFNALLFLTNKTSPFTIHLAGQSIRGTIVVTPFILTNDMVLGGGICAIFAIIIFIITRKTRRVPLQR